MSHPHPLHVSIEDRKRLEGVSDQFITDGIWRAREKTIHILNLVRSEIKEGMTEDEGRKLTMGIFADHGVKKHWHRVYVRFGPGTVLTFNDPDQAEYRLQPNDPFYLDLGPVWKDEELGLEYEGDYGDTFVFGENVEGEKCAEAARQLFREAKQEWIQKKASGEAIYAFLNRRATEIGYSLLADVEGHRVSDFPHQRYSKQHLAQVPFEPAASLWVLEIKLTHPTLVLGSFFEDLL